MENQESAPNQKPKSLSIIITTVVLGLGALLAVAFTLFKGNNPTQTNDQDFSSNVPQSQKYKDGSYSITQNYQSPGGTEQFDLSLTLLQDTITSANFTPKAVSPTGKRLQGGFSQTFQPYVVGKNIDQVAISVISGASLTSGAFKLALENIKQQAK